MKAILHAQTTFALNMKNKDNKCLNLQTTLKKIRDNIH